MLQVEIGLASWSGLICTPLAVDKHTLFFQSYTAMLWLLSSPTEAKVFPSALNATDTTPRWWNPDDVRVQVELITMELGMGIAVRTRVWLTQQHNSHTRMHCNPERSLRMLNLTLRDQQNCPSPSRPPLHHPHSHPQLKLMLHTASPNWSSRSVGGSTTWSPTYSLITVWSRINGNP